MRASFAVLAALTACCILQVVRCHDAPHPKSSFPLARLRVLLEEGITLTPSVGELTANEQLVGVRVDGVAAPEPSDLIALYAPPSADPTRVVPLAWANIAASSPEYLKTGSGSIMVRVINHRADAVFRLVRNGSTLPWVQRVVVAAESPIVRNTVKDLPAQVHLALDAGGSYVVQWVSGSSAVQYVQWGFAADRLDGSAVPSTAVTYTADQMCGAPANGSGWSDPGWLHQATLPVQAHTEGRRLFYRIGVPASGFTSIFSTALPAPQPGEPVRFVMLADVGQASPVLFKNRCPPYCPPGYNWSPSYGTNSTKLLRNFAKEDAHVALLLGDLAYAQGYAADWDVFFTQFQSAFTRWPVMAAPGNHERDWPGTGDVFQGLSVDSGGECNVPYTYRMHNPGNYPKLDPRQSYYAFDLGNVHFLILDSETDSSDGSPQHAFAADDLDRVDRSRTPWVVVGMHRMVWAPTTDTRPVVGDVDNSARLQRDYNALFARHKVSLVMYGHEHAYARTCPLLNGACVGPGAGGTVFILSGNAGAGFTNGFPRNANGTGYDFPGYVEYGAQFQNGYMRVVADASAMRVEAVSSDDGHVFDRVTIPAAAPAGSGVRKEGGLSGSGGGGAGGISRGSQLGALDELARVGVAGNGIEAFGGALPTPQQLAKLMNWQ